MGDYTPVNNAETFTSTASATITGGQLCTASGAGTVAPSTTGDHSVGVALHDAPSGGRVTLAMISSVIHELPIQNTIAIAAGAPVIAGTAGSVATGTLATVAGAGTLLGICLTGGTGNAGLTVKARFMGIG
jgi:predicted RecA/RadA family phage recombinase